MSKYSVKFSSYIRYSGHSPSFRCTILKKVIERYEVELANHLEEKKKMFRSRPERMQMKQEMMITNLRDTWFRKGGYTSTLMVPATPDGILAEKIRKNLENVRQPKGTKIKVLEDGGVSIQLGAVKPNPFPKEGCDRADCLICFHRDGKESGMKCYLSNVGYESVCTKCDEPFAYIGETSRTAYSRFREHLGNYKSAAKAKLPALPQANGGEVQGRVKSFMWEHTQDFHEGQVGEVGGMGDFKASVVNKFSKCLPRQVNEDIRMQEFESKGGTLLNSKQEYYTPKSVQTVFRHQ